MDDAARVRRRERLARLARERNRELRGQRLLRPRDARPEVLAREELRHEEVHALGGLSRVVDLDHVRVRDARDALHLALEAGHDLRLAHELLAEHLHGDEPVGDAEVLGLEDAPHPPFAELPDDLIRVREDAANPRIRRLRRRAQGGRVLRADAEIRGISSAARRARARLVRRCSSNHCPKSKHNFVRLRNGAKVGSGTKRAIDLCSFANMLRRP